MNCKEQHSLELISGEANATAMDTLVEQSQDQKRNNGPNGDQGM
jgi:hypothetical protein